MNYNKICYNFCRIRNKFFFQYQDIEHYCYPAKCYVNMVTHEAINSVKDIKALKNLFYLF